MYKDVHKRGIPILLLKHWKQKTCNSPPRTSYQDAPNAAKSTVPVTQSNYIRFPHAFCIVLQDTAHFNLGKCTFYITHRQHTNNTQTTHRQHTNNAQTTHKETQKQHTNNAQKQQQKKTLLGNTAWLFGDV